MADKKFQNEDPTVELSVRITVQVRADSISYSIQGDPEVLFPSTTLERKKVGRREGSTVAEAVEVSMAKLAAKAPELLADISAAQEEVW